MNALTDTMGPRATERLQGDGSDWAALCGAGARGVAGRVPPYTLPEGPDRQGLRPAHQHAYDWRFALRKCDPL